MTEEHKQFLDNLHESGICNMFGACQHLQEEFGMIRQEAREVLRQWIMEVGK